MTQTKPLLKSRTNLVAFVILVLNAAALAFAGATVDSGSLVDAVLSGQHTEAISMALSILVVLFRSSAVSRIQGIFR